MELFIQAEKLTVTKTFTGEDGEVRQKRILSDISFAVEAGKVFGIMGPSGSGKTTLLRLLNRLEDPTDGVIYVQKKKIDQIPVLELRRKIGFVHQVPRMFEGKVIDNLLFGPRLIDVPEEQIRQKIYEYLPWFNLDKNILNRNPKQLSVGEKQRVSILRALMNDLDALLLDEPTSALDPTSANGILKLINEINQKKNMTIIIVSHIPQQVKQVATTGMILMDGKKLADGTVKELFENPRDQRVRDFLEGKFENNYQDEKQDMRIDE